MNKQEKTSIIPQRYIFIPPPPVGYVEELMNVCGATHNTVRYALRNGTYTRKAEQIRQEYYLRYIKPYLNQSEL